MAQVIALINDKTDGYLDHLLPNGHIEVAEEKIGCVNNLGRIAVSNLTSRLPQVA